MSNGIYNIYNPLGVNYLTRLRIGFSHLKKHKFKHHFQDSIDSICNCSSVTETKFRFFHCVSFNTQRQTLFDKIATIDANVLIENEDSIVKTCQLNLFYHIGHLIIHYSNANYFISIYLPGVFDTCTWYTV